MKPVEIADAIAKEPYAWPGGYERFAITDDGGVLCHVCCRDERERIAESTEGDGFYIEAEDSTINCDMDELVCDHCSRVIFDPAD